MPSKFNFYRLNVNHQAGYSLLELSIIIIILGIMAAAVVPSFFSTSESKLDQAVQTVVQALRYARSESMRTGAVHGARIDVDDDHAITKDVHVYDMVEVAGFYKAGTTLYHPVSKQPYNLWIRKGNLGQHVHFKTTPLPFTYHGFGTVRSIFFTPQGQPIHKKSGVLYRLESGAIVLQSSEHVRTITVHPLTGQVTVQ